MGKYYQWGPFLINIKWSEEGPWTWNTGKETTSWGLALTIAENQGDRAFQIIILNLALAISILYNPFNFNG